MQKIARDYLNCRYEPLKKGSNLNDNKSKKENFNFFLPISSMPNYFKFANPFWYAIIPPALFVTFVSLLILRKNKTN